jgi:serine/threonine protein phosphatase 1
MFKQFDYSGGRTFVVGDIHGEFGLLEDALYKLDFDRSQDHLYSVGDLVDRGPASHAAIKYLREPWFHAVRGNHEQMVIDAGGTYWHTSNGGQWFADLDDNTQAKTVAAFKNLPYIMQFTSPSGKQIGVVHAAFNFDSWHDIDAILSHCNVCDSDYNPLLWDRDQVRRAKYSTADNNDFVVKGIDHIYCGHTPIGYPLTRGNISWIDTGAFATGNLTVVEVL